MTENIGKVFSGSEFKQIYKTEFYKILKNDLIHFGHEYVNGINICAEKFNSNGECSSGGLYFTELNKVPMWLKYTSNLTYIVKVEILDDSLIYVENDKFKTDKFLIHLSAKCEIQNFPYWNNYDFYKLAVQQNCITLQYVKPELQTEELCMVAVQKYSLALQYVKPELQL